MSLKELQEKLGKARDKVVRLNIRKEERAKLEKDRSDMSGGDRITVGEDNGRIDVRKSLDDSTHGYGYVDEKRKMFIRKAHDFNDACMLLYKLKGPEAMRRFLVKKQWENIRKAAMDTTDTANWVPTGMSATLIDMVRYRLLIGALFTEETMPTKVYDPPFLAGSGTAYLVDESTDSTGTKPTSTTLTDGKATLTAKDIKARIIFSDDLEEDSIINILDKARQEIARALAEADEDAMLNGDTTTPHASADVDPAQTWASASGVHDARYAYDGIRKELLANSLTTSLATFNVTNLSRMMAECKEYAQDKDRMVWICSSKGEHKLRTLTEFLTMDKVGDRATILRGQVGVLLGAPVVISGKMRDNQTSAGVYDGSSPADDKTSIALIHRDTWLRGNRRQVTVETDKDIETGQRILVATQRTAFRQIYADGQTYGRLGIAVDW